jgi:hypothetical protein
VTGGGDANGEPGRCPAATGLCEAVSAGRMQLSDITCANEYVCVCVQSASATYHTEHLPCRCLGFAALLCLLCPVAIALYAPAVLTHGLQPRSDYPHRARGHHVDHPARRPSCASSLSRHQELHVEKQVCGVVMTKMNEATASAHPAIDATPKACMAPMLPFSPDFSLRRTPSQPQSQGV